MKTDTVDLYAMRREDTGLNDWDSVKKDWSDQDITSTYFEHYFTNLTMHPMLFGVKNTDDIRRNIANLLTDVVCAKELFWKRGEPLWWPAGFLVFEIYEDMRVTPYEDSEGTEKAMKTKFEDGLIEYVSNPDDFDKKYSGFSIEWKTGAT